MELADGRYRLDEILGTGGAATVYRAWDTKLEVHRAIKLLHEVAESQEVASDRRMLAEAKAMARLDHPNVLRVYDIGKDGGRDYVVMDIAEGGTLADLLGREGTLSPALALKYGIQILAALATAHAKGIVHRDVKPQNVLLDEEGTAKLADFGIALLADDLTRDTKTGIAMGSMAFMAPEQRLDARSVGPQADIYAVGCTLYALITGRNPIDLFAAHTKDARWEGMDPATRAMIQKATTYKRETRYGDAREMAADVLALLEDAGEKPMEPPRADDPSQFPLPSREVSTLGGPTSTTAAAVDSAIHTLSDMGVVPTDPTLLPHEREEAEVVGPIPRHPSANIEDDDDSPLLRWAGLIVFCMVALIGANWYFGTFSDDTPSTHPSEDPAPTEVVEAPQPEPAAPDEPIDAELPEDGAADAVEAAPAPEPKKPAPRAGPAPLGAWQGSINGQKATLVLSGTVGQPTGVFTVTLGDNAIASEVAGTYEPENRRLILRDLENSDTAGTYTATLEPSLERMSGTFSFRNKTGTTVFALRR